MNSVVLVGRLTKDPELAYTANTQNAVCKFDIAINRPRRNGEDQGADYPRVVVWGKQAENCNHYLSKGSQVAVQGKIQTGSYTNREGQKVFITEVVANNVEFLSNSQSSQNNKAQNPVETESDFADVPYTVANDNIPF